MALAGNECIAAVINADALAGLGELPDDSFYCVVTSPPYFWARDYGFDGQIGHEETLEEFVGR